MKLKKITTALSASAVLLLFVCSNAVKASEANTSSSQTVQKLPLTKKIHGVKRWGPWHNSAYTVPVDTPWEIPYNDGTYNGYLHRETMYQEFKNNKIRWIVYYGGTVRLRSHGTIVLHKNNVQE